jgi:hypothetical protein
MTLTIISFVTTGDGWETGGHIDLIRNEGKAREVKGIRTLVQLISYIFNSSPLYSYWKEQSSSSATVLTPEKNHPDISL